MRYDVVIVGGGCVGCVLAARLSEDPSRSILLLEAGPDYPTVASWPEQLKDRMGNSVYDPAYNWIYDGIATSRQEKPLPVYRGKLIGGSSSVNGSIFLRGASEDYDSWGPRWTYEEVLPFFRKLEADHDFSGEEHGSDGLIPVHRDKRSDWLPFQESFYRAVVSRGFPEKHDLNSSEGSGVGPLPRNVTETRVSTALAYLDPVRSRPNLTVHGDALVTRVLLDGTKATGVEAIRDRATYTVEAAEVILSAGAIASPHLLMMSGIGDPDKLRRVAITVLHDLPGVGQNLGDHPIVQVALRPEEAHKPTANGPRMQVGLAYTSTGSQDRNDMQMIAQVGSSSPPAHEQPLKMISTLELPRSTGELRVTSANVESRPQVLFRYLEDPLDLKRMREALQLSVELLSHDAFDGIVAERLSPKDADLGSDSTIDDWLLRHVGTSYHSSGTCKMGVARDPSSVVDESCRVLGLDRLRVVDLSIAPTPVRANPNSTAIMIGERVAALIAEEAGRLGPTQESSARPFTSLCVNERGG